MTDTDYPAGCMTPAQRDAIDGHFKAISEIMRSLNHVKLSGGWRVEGRTQDGRQVVHKFSVGGYVKTHPPGYGSDADVG